MDTNKKNTSKARFLLIKDPGSPPTFHGNPVSSLRTLLGFAINQPHGQGKICGNLLWFFKCFKLIKGFNVTEKNGWKIEVIISASTWKPWKSAWKSPFLSIEKGVCDFQVAGI